jgi:surface protein
MYIAISNSIGASSRAGGSSVNEAFEFTVKTDNTGTSASNQFTIPITSSTPYNISTSDGQSITGATGATTLTFPSAGTYTVSITESCEGWRFNNGGDKLKLLDISNWGVYKNTISQAFFGATNMTCTAVDEPINEHTAIEGCFRNCSNFNGAVGNWRIASTPMGARYIFSGASSFNQPLNDWNTVGFNNLTSCFVGAISFNQPIGNWDTSNVTDTNYMFYNAISFDQNIGAWDMGSNTNMGGMFRASPFNNGGSPDINNWDTSSVTTMFEMFFQVTEFNQPIGSWDVSNVTDFRLSLSSKFAGAGSFNQDISAWTPISATTMQNMFHSQTSFNSNLNSWDVSSVTGTGFQEMFGACSAFNRDISSWDVSNATSFASMFLSARSFNQDISGWNVSNCTNFGGMFNNADSFNQPIGSWTINTTSPVSMASMFQNNDSFNQDIGAWDMSQVTNMASMFRDAIAFNNGGSPNINNWNTSNVTTMNSMFYNGGIVNQGSFNQPIGNWNTSSVTDMRSMFYYNTAFDQPIGAWDTSNVTDMNAMFYITIIDQDLSNWNIGSIPPNSQNFNWVKRSNFGIPFSTANYDAMLVAYEAQVPPVGLVWDIGDATYTLGSAAEAARTSLVNTYGWTITDGGGIAVPFTITVDTTLGDGLDQFTIPTTGTGYNYDVATSDGQSITGNTGNTTITFPAAGTYDIEITGDFPRIYFNNGGDKLKLTDIKKWGSIGWTNMANAFQGCNNLTITATDAPNVSSVTSFFFAFHTCSSLSGSFDCASWDLSSVTDIGYMFFSCTQLTDINLSSLNPALSVYSDGIVASDVNLTNITFPVAFKPTSVRYMFQNTPNLLTVTNIEAWNTSAMSLCQFMFDRASLFNQNISSWDMSNVTDTQWMFAAASSFNQPIGSWDVSNILRADRMFSRASSFNQNLPNWTWTNLQFQGLDYMFERASSFNGDLSNWTFPNVTRLVSVFDGISGVMAFNNNSIANWNVSNITTLQNCFRNCRNMNVDLSSWNTTSLTSLSQTFFEADAFNFNSIVNWDIVDVSSFLNFMLGVPNLTTGTYDAILVSWEAQLQAAYPGGVGYTPTISISFNTSQYTLGGEVEAARTSLINTFGWTITDGGGVAEVPFIMNVQSNNGTFSYVVKTNPSYTYDYNISTSDGQTFSNLTGDQEIFFPNNNAYYDLEITGKFPALYTNNNVLSSRIIEIKQWGSQVWRSFDSAFYGCSLLSTVSATDSPNTNLVDSMYRTFYNCGPMVGIDFSTWNTSNVTTFAETFRTTQGTGWHSQVVNWNTSKAISMFRMFANVAYNQDLSNWDVSSVTNFGQMFSNNNVIDQSFAAWDIGQATLVSTAFSNFISTGTLSRANYDATLISWAAQAPTNNVAAIFGSSQYTLGGAAEAARNTLVNTYNWTITDGGGIVPPLILRVDTSLGDGLPNMRLPMVSGTYDVDWGDGNVATGQTGGQTHAYATGGVYDIKVTGGTLLQYNFGADVLKVTNLVQWGASAWVSAYGMFGGCENMVITATDIPNWSSCVSFSRLFRRTTFTNVPNIDQWDVSNVSNLSEVFQETVYDADVSSWQITQVTNFNNFTTLPNAFSTANYDSILIAWEAQAPPNIVTINFGGSKYTLGSAAETARTSLINTYGWTIIDGGGI